MQTVPFRCARPASALLLLALAALVLAPAARAQAQARQPMGVGFQLATRFWSPSDDRFSAGSTVVRLQFRADEEVFLFYEKEDTTLTFENSGTGATIVSGTVSAEGVGFGMLFASPLRFELMMGRAHTYINNGTLVSSDPVLNLGLYYTYRPRDTAFLDLGVIYRRHTLTNTLPGNVVDGSGTSSSEPVDDLGGTLLHLGVGYGF